MRTVPGTSTGSALVFGIAVQVGNGVETLTAAFAFMRKIDYIVEECPFAAGATSIAHKEILSRMEAASPGAKHNFLFGFLDRARPAFERAEGVTLNECARCGQVTTGTICAFCKLSDQVKRRVS